MDEELDTKVLKETKTDIEIPQKVAGAHEKQNRGFVIRRKDALLASVVLLCDSRYGDYKSAAGDRKGSVDNSRHSNVPVFAVLRRQGVVNREHGPGEGTTRFVDQIPHSKPY